MTLLEKLALAQGNKPSTATTPAAAPVVAAKPESDLAAKIRARLATPGQINPPDAASPAADKGLAAAIAPKVTVISTVAEAKVAAGMSPVVAPIIIPAADRKPAAAPVEASARRQPRNGGPRLAALGWDEYAISCMSVDRKHEILDGNIHAPAPVEADVPPDDGLDVIDLNSNEALELGESLGWTEEDMNSMEDEVFARILAGRLLAAGWTVKLDEAGERIVDIAIIQVQNPTVAVEAPKRTRTPRPGNTTVVPAAPVPVSTPAVLEVDIEAQLAAAEPTPVPVTVERFLDAVAGPVKPAEEQAVDNTTQPVDDAPAPLMLFIDCRPTKGFADAVELLDYCQPLMQMVCERKKVEVYNLPSFNEGEKLVSALLLMNPPSGMILVDTSSPLSKWALEVLLPLAKMVVRGARS